MSHKKDQSKQPVAGTKYNYLTAIEFSHRDKYRTGYWKFQCDCGKFTFVPAIRVTSGVTKSCGCIFRKKQTGVPKTKNRYSPSEKPYWLVYKYVMTSAKTRNREFGLTFEDTKEITTKNCFYCNLPPSNRIDYSYKTDKQKNYHYYSGIDRINNNIGYEKENVVPCCKTCNKSKSTLSQSEFLSWVARVAKHSLSAVISEQ